MTTRAFRVSAHGFWVAGCIAFQIAAGTAVAQEASTKTDEPRDISFLPRWTKGELRIYEQLKVRRLIPKGGTTSQASSRARLDIKVVEAGPKGYVLSWTISESSLDGSRQPEQQGELANLLKAMENWTVLLDLDESGNLRGVQNWKEIKAKAEALNDSILRSRNFRALSPEQQAKFRSQLKARLQSREQVEELCTREAKAFLAPIGLRFKSGQPIAYETQLQNPRGGKPFPARARFDVSRIDPSTARAIVDWRQIVDPNASAAGLGDAVNRLGRGLGRPPSPGSSDPYKSLSISDECRYLMDMRSGWVNDMKQMRLIRNQDGSSIEESLRIRRVDQFTKKSKTEPTKAPASPIPNTR